MRAFEDLNPATAAFYYLSAVSIAMFSMNPVLHIICFCGALAQFLIICGNEGARIHFLYLTIGIILALVRPVFSHNGVTVLFVFNDNPITLESFIFGINSAVMVVGVLYLFRVVSGLFTSDRLLYLFGGFSPKTALVMSSGLRFMPMIRRRYREIAMYQTAIGINKDENIPDRIKNAANTLSATVTWGLENGIITADSMAARYYGTKKRSRFRLFKFCGEDLVLFAVMVILLTFPVICMIKHDFDTVFYPTFQMKGTGAFTVAGYLSYALLMLVPLIMRGMVMLRWKLLISKTG